MRRHLCDDGMRFVDEASWVDEFSGVESTCTGIALIASGILCMPSAQGSGYATE